MTLDFFTFLDQKHIIIIHNTHHLQPGIRGNDLVLFILA